MIVLNLLPAERKKGVATILTMERWRPSMLASTIVILLLVGAMQVVTWQLQRHQNDIHAQFEAQQKSLAEKETGDIRQTTLHLNDTIKQLATLTARPRAWSTDSAAILSGLPADITVSNLTIQASGQVQLEGLAKTRASFLALTKALEQNKALSSVKTSSTASKRDNIPFAFTAVLAPKP